MYFIKSIWADVSTRNQLCDKVHPWKIVQRHLKSKGCMNGIDPKHPRLNIVTYATQGSATITGKGYGLEVSNSKAILSKLEDWCMSDNESHSR